MHGILPLPITGTTNMEINKENQSAWLKANAGLASSDEYHERLAYGLAGIAHHLNNNGYTLKLGSNNEPAVYGPPGFMAAVVGVELSAVLGKVGLQLMESNWQMEFNWPANASGVVLYVELM